MMGWKRNLDEKEVAEYEPEEYDIGEVGGGSS